jgi:hypothetical protein
MAKQDKSKQKLSVEQLNAIDLLVTGKTDQEVADLVGVSRSTVTFWRLYNPTFAAELNKRRKEVWGAAGDRMRTLLLKAFDVVESALNAGDIKAALEFLKVAGVNNIKLDNIGPEEPEEIIKAEKEKNMLETIMPMSDDEIKLLMQKVDRRHKEWQKIYDVET